MPCTPCSYITVQTIKNRTQLFKQLQLTLLKTLNTRKQGKNVLKWPFNYVYNLLEINTVLNIVSSTLAKYKLRKLY